MSANNSNLGILTADRTMHISQAESLVLFSPALALPFQRFLELLVRFVGQQII